MRKKVLLVLTLVVPANTTLLLQLIIRIHLFFFTLVSSFYPSYFSPYTVVVTVVHTHAHTHNVEKRFVYHLLTYI